MMGGKLGNIWPAAGSHHGVRGDQKPTKNDDETDSCNTYLPFLERFLWASRTFMDCGVFRCYVSASRFPSRNLRGTFADLHGLRCF